MPNTHSNLTSLFSDIADAIRGKTGSLATIVADDFPTAIANIPTGGGGGGSATDPVRFIDYDGTILYSYSAADFANLNAFPDNPSHSGLTAQGWNWALADAKTYVATYGKLDIGQMYITDDDKTRIYIRLADSAGLSPYFGICPNGEVRVDWGDGSNMTTFSGSSYTTVIRTRHTYASTGDYVITLEVINGSFAIYGGSSYGTYLLRKTNTEYNQQFYYQCAIRKVELGKHVALANYAFQDCRSLESITMPINVTAVGTSAFNSCYSLKSITIPTNMTAMGDYTFNYCYGLRHVIMSNRLASIGSWAFRECYALESVTIPSSVTVINEYAFYNCRALESLTLPNSVTTAGAQAFGNCYALSSITIPSSMTRIGDHTFSACYDLESLTIPSNITILDTSAFSNCETLASITIPSSVTSIGKNAFYGGHSLSEIHLLRATPPTLVDKNAFSGIFSDCIFYVPSASLSSYQSATNWSNYRTKMVGE